MTRRLLPWLLRGLIAAGLAIDSYVHADLAGIYDGVGAGHLLSQGLLFRAEAVVSGAVALLVLVAGNRRQVLGAAAVVAGSAFGALLLYRYVDVGQLGPIPNMYEPAWFPEKNLAAIAEAVATGSALLAAAFASLAGPPPVRPSRSVGRLAAVSRLRLGRPR